MPSALRPLFERLRKEKKKFTLEFPFQPSRRWQQFFIKIKKPHLCFHCLRDTYVNRLRRAGVPREAAMRLVNHASELIHQIYQREKVEDVKCSVLSAKNYRPDILTLEPPLLLAADLYLNFLGRAFLTALSGLGRDPLPNANPVAMNAPQYTGEAKGGVSEYCAAWQCAARVQCIRKAASSTVFKNFGSTSSIRHDPSRMSSRNHRAASRNAPATEFPDCHSL